MKGQTRFDYVGYVFDMVRDCVAYMDIGKVRQFCLAVNAAAQKIREMPVAQICDLDDLIDAAVLAKCRETGKARLDAASLADVVAAALLPGLALVQAAKKERPSMYEACQTAWVALAVAQCGMSEAYARSEFKDYVDLRFRDHRVSDYTVATLPRLLDLFDIR